MGAGTVGGRGLGGDPAAPRLWQHSLCGARRLGPGRLAQVVDARVSLDEGCERLLHRERGGRRELPRLQLPLPLPLPLLPLPLPLHLLPLLLLPLLLLPLLLPELLLARRGRRRRRREQRDLRVRVREPHGLDSLRRPAQRLLGGVQADHAVIRPKACGLRGAGCVAAALVDRAVVEQHAVAASPLYKRPESAGERGERAAARVRVLCREPGVRDTHHRQAVGPARPRGQVPRSSERPAHSRQSSQPEAATGRPRPLRSARAPPLAAGPAAEAVCRRSKRGQ